MFFSLHKVQIVIDKSSKIAGTQLYNYTKLCQFLLHLVIITPTNFV